MARRKNTNPSPQDTPLGATGAAHAEGAPGTGQVLALVAGGATRTKIAAAMGDIRLQTDFVSTVDQARGALSAHDYDVLLVDLDHAGTDAARLVREQSLSGRAARSIVACRKPDLETAVAAMRHGAADLIRMPIDKPELQERVIIALEQAARTRRQARRVERLRRLCRRLQAAQDRVAEQVDVLCDDLSDAIPAKGANGRKASIGVEYGGMIRRELDVEQLLRTTLEYLLTKSGPTNAAVFLPSGHDDYSLGAYVNYDMPKDAVDVLLDHLADVVPARFERESAIVRLRSDGEIRAALGDGLGWLNGTEMMIFNCVSNGETLAVAAVFRDASKPFAGELTQTLDALRTLFAEQLERVINIHNRHLPKSEWPGAEEDGEGGQWGGMAA